MRYLLGDQWADTFLDYHCGPNDYRIRIQAFANIEQLTGIYFVRPRSARLLWNYLHEVGFVEVWRKVVSRMQEKYRNEKFVSFGLGVIVQAPSDGVHAVDDVVAFLAPGFPACVERIVLPEAFITEPSAAPPADQRDGEIQYLAGCEGLEPEGDWWKKIRGWNVYSGYALDERDRSDLAGCLRDLVAKADWSSARRLSADPPTELREKTALTTSSGGRESQGRKKRGVLFGYGHYAKTNILPNIRRHIEVETIHEVDPTQTPQLSEGGPVWDTAPIPRDGYDYEVYLIAGYHHTHAPLAVSALECDAYAVVEKPLAVDGDQLTDLLAALDASNGGYFGCFHKRYSPLNDFAIRDLRQSVEKPIDYHCIVYEVPLPDLHWYRWPNSKSRLISNGCHWIDHFLYLNGYDEVESLDLDQSPSGTINCSVTLRNGAYFTMALTDTGSERIGLQEHVELRAGDVTVTMINNSNYIAENSSRVLRRLHFNKMVTYKLMYKAIAERIARGEQGDTAQSLRVSTRLILDLEDRLQQFRNLETEMSRLGAEDD
jgi:predicted dehydrogenase